MMRPLLNVQQQAAVHHTDGASLILAGAGSGKTRVLLEKILYLIRHHLVSADKILAITFTQHAANELRQRLKVAGKECQLSVKEVTVGTFHATALSILRRHRRYLGDRSRLLLCSDQDKRHIIQTLLGQNGQERWSLDVEERLCAKISLWKNEGLSCQKVHQRACKEEKFAAKLYEQYQAHLQRFGWVDFDDLMQMAFELLSTHPVCLEQEQAHYHYLLIDEFQDTNRVQWQFAQRLIGDRPFTVVGDDDQSIYGWRGAHPALLEEVMTTYPRLKVIKLEKSYRCSVPILNIANEVIGHNPHLFEKILDSDRQGEPVRLITLPDAEAEADWIVEEIEKERAGSASKKIAILYRSHHQSQLLQQALKEKKIECMVIGQEEFLDKVEPRLLVDYWTILSDLESDASLLRIINVPKRGIGASTLQKIAQWAGHHQKSYWETLVSFGFLCTLKRNEQCAVERLTQWIHDHQKKIWALERNHGANWGKYLTSLIAELNLELHFSQGISEKFFFVRRKRLHKICALFLSQLKYSKTQECPGGNFTLALNKLQALYSEPADVLSKGEPPIFLMTVHASKGLEFDSLYLCGLEQGILPHRSAINEWQIQEERRLFYVGITRARSKLTLTYAMSRTKQRRHCVGEPSMFLKEISEKHLSILKILPETLHHARTGIAHKYLSQLRKNLEQCSMS